jgi:hypothetical protein
MGTRAFKGIEDARHVFEARPVHPTTGL